LQLLLQQLINGLVLGINYGLMASGLSLIFGIMRVINFAHGELYMFGAYLTVLFMNLLGLSYIWSGVISILMVVVISFLIERVSVHQLLKRDPMTIFLSTFAISIILSNVAQLIFGVRPKRMPSPFDVPVDIQGIILTEQKILTFVIGIVVVIGLSILIQKTKIGKILRATSQNTTPAQLVGINTRAVYMYAFGIAGGLAALSGILLAPSINLYPTMGTQVIIKGFVIVVLGGLGSVNGAFAGGLLLGVIEVLTASYFGSGFKDVVGYIILVAILIWRPSGLFGKAISR